jgi:hypothetical protein
MKLIRQVTKKDRIDKTDGVCEPIDNSQYRWMKWCYRVVIMQTFIGCLVAYSMADMSKTSKWLGFAISLAIGNVLILMVTLNISLSEMGTHQYTNVEPNKPWNQEFRDRIKQIIGPGYEKYVLE